MKKTISKITLVYILVTLGTLQVNSQIIQSNPKQEKLNLFTDRTLYVSGEQIQFAAYLFLNNNAPNISLTNVKDIDELDKLIKNFKKPQNESRSKILYVELITPEGEKISKGKFLCANLYCNGFISIPKDITTGSYYLRTYTKFMRNSGPSSYSYILLKIINPNRPEIQPYYYPNTSFNDSVPVKDSLNSQILLSLSTDKEEYYTRERINCQIKGVNIQNNSLKYLNLSVISESSIIERKNFEVKSDNSSPSQYYYPEIKGLSITGKLKDSKSGNSLPNAMVNLSILGDCKDFMSVKTDSSGRFFFKLPDFKGVRDVFLITEEKVDSKSTINIDNDFCQAIVQIPTPIFKLSEIERKTAYNFAINTQIASHFNITMSIKDTIKVIDKPFYGDPKMKRSFDNYIQLPTFEDYINEVIPILTIKKEQGKKQFKIFNSQAEMSIYRPLVLLDMVAIDNLDKILLLPPQKISHVEIIDAAYIKGDITYGGIVSIFSKKGDFAGIDLPSSGLFLDFNFLNVIDNSPKEIIPLNNQPDTRNTLLWEPSIALDSNNSFEQSFTSSDTPGRYTILLRGVTNEGKEFSFKKTIVIKNKK